MASSLIVSPMCPAATPPLDLALAPVLSPPTFSSTQYTLLPDTAAVALDPPPRTQWLWTPLANDDAVPIDGAAPDLLQIPDGPPRFVDTLDDPLTLVRLGGLAMLIAGMLAVGIDQANASQARLISGGTLSAFGGLTTVVALW